MNIKTLFQMCVSTAVLSLGATLAQAQSSAYFQAVTHLNPAGYWPMHEVEVPAAGDIETNYGTLGSLGNGFYPDWASANGNILLRGAAGALTNSGDNDPSVHYTKTIITGSAVSFTNGLFVPHTSPQTTLTPPFSVEFWYFPTNNSTGVTIWSQCGLEGLNAGAEGATTGLINGIVMNWANSTFVVYGLNNQLNLSIQNSNKVAVENTVMPSNQWYHLVVTCGAQTNFVLYTNGLQAATGNGVGKYSPDYWTPLSIGCGLGNTRSIAGLIDEFAVYTNALSASDVAAHYAAANTANASPSYFQLVTNDNPTIYLRMDSPAYAAPPVASWPVLSNFGGLEVSGVYSPGTTPGNVPGMTDSNGIPCIGLAVAGGTNVPQLSGVSSFADAGFDPAFNPTGPTPFSVTALFRGNPCDNRLQTIIGHSGNSWAINVSTTGKLQCQMGTNTASLVTSAKVYNDGNWHQVVEVYSPASIPTVTGTNILYVDGVLDSLVSTVTTNGILPGTNLDVLIAGDPQFTNNPAGVGRQFAGQVSEAAIFTNALTALQVQQLYAAIGVLPAITQQPITASVNAGSAFTNIVMATGGILGYQWYKDGGAITGQTNASMILNPVRTTDASTDYYVVVTNAYASTTSSVVSLTVNSAPVIVTETSVATVYAGHNPTLLVNAAGSGTLFYQWTSNGVAIAGATNSSYTVVNAQAAATYSGTVSNALGTNPYNPILLTVLPAPTNPYPATVLADHPMDYWRLDEADGTVSLDYISAFNGAYTNALLNQSGYTSLFAIQTDPTETSVLFGNSTTNDSYMGFVPANVNFATPSNANAEFSVEAWIQPSGISPAGAGLVSLGYGTGGEQFCLDLAASSNVLGFFVRNAAGTAFTAQSNFEPDANWHYVVGVCDEANGSLYVYADGQLVGSNSVPVGGGLLTSTNSLVIGSRQEGLGTPFDEQFMGKMDDVALYNYALSSNQVLAHYYSAGIAPQNLQPQPPNLTVNQNENGTFTATATGTPPLFYYWTDSDNGNSLLSTNASLVINSAQTADNYEVVVSNAFGTASASVSLTVNSGPVYIATQPLPSDIQAPPAYPISLTATAGGTAPFQYQWYLNSSTPIPGATNATYSFLSSVGTNTYTLWVTNQFGGPQTASSDPVTVEVGAIPIAIGFNSGSGWNANNKASFAANPGALQLTDGNLNEIGSAFFETPQYVEGFLATFTYTPSTGSTPIRADGATFCLQNAPRNVAAIGTDGGGLGYFGITPSVAFEMDIFVNRAGGPGINLETNGLTSGNGGLHNGGTGPVNINSGDPIDVALFYDSAAGQLTVSLLDESTTAAYATNYHVGDLGKLLGSSYAYVGFTGGSGGDGAVQTISNFAFSYSQTPSVLIAPAAGGNVTIGWPGAIVTTNFVLQQSDNISGPWSNVAATPSTPTVENDQYQITVPVTESSQFYRLSLVNP